MAPINRIIFSLSVTDMARDTAVGREHVLIVPSSLTLDGGSPQQSGMAQNDINQQILEVSSTNTIKLHPVCYLFYSSLNLSQDVFLLVTQIE